ncbi:MAG: aminotransferase class I/II-fold pyridoxal phosphate-dependent enzyme [Gemmatimonadetes bacterium]|nr:aminotransferase class I/II-fold pyridoxal phosphate-dependent enzyme [Gemmatimonadota bacterium]
MKIPRFTLEHWMRRYEAAPPRHSLAGSAGPCWTVGEVLALGGVDPDEVMTTPILYAPFEGSTELRTEVANYVGVQPEDVLITTGASEAIAILIASRAEANGNVVVPSPGYPSFAGLTQVFGMEPREYRLRREDGFAIDPDRVLSKVDPGTRAVIVNSPHNPTGSLASREALLALAAALNDRGVPLIVDRVFHSPGDDAEPWGLDELPGAIPIGDMSKALSLPGLRVGWIADRDVARRGPYLDLRGYFTLSNAPLAERLATIALQHRGRVLARRDSVARANLSALALVIDRHLAVDWVRPRGGATSFPWLTSGRDAHPFCERLAEAGVLTVPGDCLGYPDHFRVGFADNEPAAFADAMEVLAEALSREDDQAAA